MGQMRQQHAPSLAHISHVRNLTQQTLTDIRRQAHLRQTTPEASLLGFLLIQLPPGQTTQLGLQHLAQPGQLGAGEGERGDGTPMTPSCSLGCCSFLNFIVKLCAGQCC